MNFLSKDFVHDIAVQYFGPTGFSIKPHNQIFASTPSTPLATIGAVPSDLTASSTRTSTLLDSYGVQVSITIEGTINIDNCNSSFVQRFRAMYGGGPNSYYPITHFKSYAVRDSRLIASALTLYTIPSGAILNNCGTITEFQKGKFAFTTLNGFTNVTVEVMPNLLVGYLTTTSSSVTDWVFNTYAVKPYVLNGTGTVLRVDTFPFVLSETTSDNILVFDAICFSPNSAASYSKMFSFVGYSITPNISNVGQITYQSFNG